MLGEKKVMQGEMGIKQVADTDSCCCVSVSVRSDVWTLLHGGIHKLANGRKRKCLLKTSIRTLGLFPRLTFLVVTVNTSLTVSLQVQNQDMDSAASEQNLSFIIHVLKLGRTSFFFFFK